MLLGAIDDRPHAFLQGKILGVDAHDAGEGPGLLDLPVDQVIVRAVALELEGAGDQVVRAAAGARSPIRSRNSGDSGIDWSRPQAQL